MEPINVVGEFPVIITNPHWVELEKGGMDLVVSLVTDDKKQYINHHIIFNETIYQSGKNQGRYAFQVNAELCEKLGMTIPFDVKNIKELEGKKAHITTKEDSFKGKTTIKVEWLNPPRKESLDIKKAAEIWDKMNSGLQPVNVTTDEEKPY